MNNVFIKIRKADTILFEIFSAFTALFISYFFFFPNSQSVLTPVILNSLNLPYFWSIIFIGIGIYQLLAVFVFSLRVRKITAFLTLLLWSWMVILLLIGANLIITTFMIFWLDIAMFLAYTQLWVTTQNE